MALILLVDSNASFRRMMEQMLRQQKHEAMGADDAEVAGRAMKEHEFDLAVVELILPGEMSGTELLQWLRDFPAPGDPARVALCSLSSFASQELYLRAELALDGFLLKPFKPSEFKSVIDGALAARAARPKTSLKQRFAAPPTGNEVIVLAPDALTPLETNPGLEQTAPPTPVEFEAASGSLAISLEDLAPPPAAAERRAVPRFPIRFPIAVHDGASPFKARAENLGRGGVFVLTDRVFEPGSKVRVRLELPVPGDGYNEISSEIVHAGEVAQGRGIGLRFGEMSDQTSRRLDEFLEQLRQPAQSRPFLVVAAESLSAEVERVAQSYRGEEVRVRLVRFGENARDVAESEPPDLMLLDLADATVVTAVGALKSTRGTSRIPVGVVDRTRSAQAALAAAAAGADRFFVLPDDLARLVNFSVDTLAASRRRSVRVKFQRPITVVLDGREEKGASVDLSETGLQVRLAAAPPEGSQIELMVSLSDGGFPLRLPAKVTWSSAAKDGAALATKVGLLIEPDEESRNRIREEVRRALTVSYYVRWLASAPKPAKPAAAPRA